MQLYRRYAQPPVARSAALHCAATYKLRALPSAVLSEFKNMAKTLHFGLFIYPGGHHLAGWRHPSVAPKEILGVEYYKRAAIAAERGLFDLYFVGDMLAAREREGRLVAEGALNNIDSISIDSAIAGATHHIG